MEARNEITEQTNRGSSVPSKLTIQVIGNLGCDCAYIIEPSHQHTSQKKKKKKSPAHVVQIKKQKKSPTYCWVDSPSSSPISFPTETHY